MMACTSGKDHADVGSLCTIGNELVRAGFTTTKARSHEGGFDNFVNRAAGLFDIPARGHCVSPPGMSGGTKSMGAMGCGLIHGAECQCAL